jgi:hypothetical protein
MKRIVVLCALAALAALAFPVLAQHTNGGQSNSFQQQYHNGPIQHLDSTTNYRSNQLWYHQTANVAKLRKKLAEVWQSLGMSPQDAKTVADAFRPELTGGTQRASLHGKSDEEVSAMIQSALAKKNYLLANQLLIDYEQARVAPGSRTGPEGVR